MIGENTHKRGLKQSIDWKLITVYILLVLIGWVNIYASIHSENPTSIIDWNFRSGKQFVWMLSPASSCSSSRPGSGRGRRCPCTWPSAPCSSSSFSSPRT